VADALVMVEDAVHEEQSTGGLQNLAHRLLDLADVCMVAGRFADALASTEQALNLARQHGDRRNGANDLHQLGEIHMRLDSPESTQAEVYFRAALTLADSLGMRPLVAHCHLGLGKLSLRTGKQQEAHEHLNTATTMYREMDMRFWVEQAETELR
jgi:tetratricopeptide (TPR) repeat protein